MCVCMCVTDCVASQDVHVYERDSKSVLSTLTQVAQLAGRSNAQYTQLLCLLCKGAVRVYHLTP